MTEQEFKKAQQLQHKIYNVDYILEKMNNNKLKLFMASLEERNCVWDVANNVDIDIELFNYIKAAIVDYRNSLQKEFAAVGCTSDKAVVETKFKDDDIVYHMSTNRTGRFSHYSSTTEGACVVFFTTDVGMNQEILPETELILNSPDMKLF